MKYGNPGTSNTKKKKTPSNSKSSPKLMKGINPLRKIVGSGTTKGKRKSTK